MKACLVPLWGSWIQETRLSYLSLSSTSEIIFIGSSCSSSDIVIRYIADIEIPGGVIKYVPLHPPKHGATQNSTAADWKFDMKELENAFTPKTKMIVRLPHLNSKGG